MNMSLVNQKLSIAAKNLKLNFSTAETNWIFLTHTRPRTQTYPLLDKVLHNKVVVEPDLPSKSFRFFPDADLSNFDFGFESRIYHKLHRMWTKWTRWTTCHGLWYLVLQSELILLLLLWCIDSDLRIWITYKNLIANLSWVPTLCIWNLS